MCRVEIEAQESRQWRKKSDRFELELFECKKVTERLGKECGSLQKQNKALQSQREVEVRINTGDIGSKRPMSASTRCVASLTRGSPSSLSPAGMAEMSPATSGGANGSFSARSDSIHPRSKSILFPLRRESVSLATEHQVEKVAPLNNHDDDTSEDFHDDADNSDLAAHMAEEAIRNLRERVEQKDRHIMHLASQLSFARGHPLACARGSWTAGGEKNSRTVLSKDPLRPDRPADNCGNNGSCKPGSADQIIGIERGEVNSTAELAKGYHSQEKMIQHGLYHGVGATLLGPMATGDDDSCDSLSTEQEMYRQVQAKARYEEYQDLARSSAARKERSRDYSNAPHVHALMKSRSFRFTGGSGGDDDNGNGDEEAVIE